MLKYPDKSINNVKSIVTDKNVKEKYKLNSKNFTRERTMSFENTVYYNLNKKGLTSKMEIEEFQDIVNMTDITSVAVLKQREKLNSQIIMILEIRIWKIFIMNILQMLNYFMVTF